MKTELITENNIQYTVDTHTTKDRFWYLGGKLHREMGPAVEWSNGDRCWYTNGAIHRNGAPAIICANGDWVWMQHGLCHREDGPALARAASNQEWWLNGMRLSVTSDEQFFRLMNLKAFL